MILVYLKDGFTAYGFEKGEDLRRALHERPGHKPLGGGHVKVRKFHRRREATWLDASQGDPAPDLIPFGEERLRFLARQSISHVVELNWTAAPEGSS